MSGLSQEVAEELAFGKKPGPRCSEQTVSVCCSRSSYEVCGVTKGPPQRADKGLMPQDTAFQFDQHHHSTRTDVSSSQSGCRGSPGFLHLQLVP